MVNVDLWAALLAAQDTCHGQVSWRWIPSDVSIPGNEEADALAERGRLVSPLYRNVSGHEVPLAKYVRTTVKPPLECYIPYSSASRARARGVSRLRRPPPPPTQALNAELVGGVLFTTSSHSSNMTDDATSTISCALTLTPSESHVVSTPVWFLAYMG